MGQSGVTSGALFVAMAAVVAIRQVSLRRGRDVKDGRRTVAMRARIDGRIVEWRGDDPESPASGKTLDTVSLVLLALMTLVALVAALN